MSILLQGDYQSEGRNILGGSGELIGKQASEDEVREKVRLFARSADKAVAKSYAGRLLAFC